MRKICFLLLFFMLLSPVLASEFGEYKYSKYLGIQQQLQRQKMNAIYRQRKYNQSPTRNIRYPRMAGQYPNIERNNNRYQMTRNQRYSSAYYNRYYR